MSKFNVIRNNLVLLLIGSTLIISFQNCGENLSFTVKPLEDSSGSARDTLANDPTDSNSSSEEIEDSGNQNTTITSGCQSDTLCVHSKMPLWSQNDGGTVGVLVDGKVITKVLNLNNSSVTLLQYVKNKGYNITKDPGWCGATSFGMISKSISRELEDQGLALPNNYPLLTSNDASEVIYESMNALGMNPILGVTSPSAIQSGFNKIAQAAQLGSASLEEKMISVNEFRIKKPHVALAIGSKFAGGHIVALNGTDGQYYVIFDPWGSSYSVTAKAGNIISETLPPDNKVISYTEYFLTYIGSGMQVLKGLEANKGFIPTYGTTGRLTTIRYDGLLNEK